VLGNNPVGALDEDLESACLKALTISRAACRTFASAHSWERSALQFIANCRPCHATGSETAGSPETIRLPQPLPRLPGKIAFGRNP
jgi:hypothetical protein